MARLDAWGLRLVVIGLFLGIALMGFVVAFDNSAFYVKSFAPTTLEHMHLDGYLLDAGIVGSFGLLLAGLALLATSPGGTESQDSHAFRGQGGRRKGD